jgi:hypothetical protein
MLDVLAEKHAELLIPLVALVAAGVVFLVWIVAHYWASTRRLEVEANLKRDMLNRGLSAADIERVLLASANQDREPPAEKETISDNEYYLVEKMLDAEYPVEQIEKLVRAFKSGDKVRIGSLEKVMAERS